ncbi:MAG: hypothetical protein M1816_003370 [Peltula sp. TS41687]|nr:MAG: hypothetical protein M1816_003370 [Peltula sp. TS41687]
MPSIPIHLPAPNRQPSHPGSSNPLPDLLKTPSGLALLEIQGTLNLPDADHLATTTDEETTPSGPTTTTETSIGRLLFPDYSPHNPVADDLCWAKRVYLYVGRHQRLTGEVKKLQRPLAVVRRKMGGGGEEEEEDEVMEEGGDENRTGRGNEELEIVEIVRWKIIFSHRPEPVGD